jgi:hypothetical protein
VPPIRTEPPPNPPPVGVARIRLLGLVGGTPAGIGFWANIGGIPTLDDLVDLATDFYGAFQTLILNHLSSSASIEECLVRYFDGEGNPQVSISAHHVGGQEDEAPPINVACVLSWKIASTYRGGKPRTYLFGISEDAVSSNRRTFNAGDMTSMTEGAGAFLDAVNAITTTNITLVNLGTVHFFSAGAALAPPLFESYTGVIAQQRVCTQRRRLGREVF